MLLLLLSLFTGHVLQPVPILTPADDPKALVKQLGSSSFTERESAQKKLEALGLPAREALEKGTSHADPEIAARCRTVLDRVLKRNAEALFLPRFVRLFGDDEHTRALFTTVMSEPLYHDALKAADANPQKVAGIYRTLFDDLTKRCETGPRQWDPSLLTMGQVLGFLYLGTYPGTESVQFDSPPIFLPHDANRWQYLTIGPAQALKDPALKIGSRRLIMKWTAVRVNQRDASVGLTCAMAYGFREAVPIVKRRLDRMKSIGTKPTESHLLDLAVIGKLGTKDDIRYLARFFDDDRVVSRRFVLLPGETIDPQTPFRDGKDCAIQFRDMAYAMAVLLAGKGRTDLDEASFFYSRFAPRDPAEAGKPLPPPGKRRWADDPYSYQDIGFIQEAHRQAALGKAREWLAPYWREPGK